MFIEDRQNITTAAKEFKSGGFTEGKFNIPRLEHPAYSFQSSETLNAWYKIKPELYTHTTVYSNFFSKQ